MPNKPKPKPAKARKPMVVWCVLDCDGDLLTASYHRWEADYDARHGHPICAPYRVVRFVESPLRRKGGK